jgi:hypothetical protein
MPRPSSQFTGAADFWNPTRPHLILNVLQCGPSRSQAGMPNAAYSRLDDSADYTESDWDSALTWDLDSLDAFAPAHLVDGLANQFACQDHPKLRIFEA